MQERDLMNRHFRNISIAIASGAVLAVAGLASAQVPDDEYTIIDKNEPESTGTLDVDGDDYEVITETVCQEFATTADTGASVRFESNHPDSVKLKKNKGEVEQSQKDNKPSIEVTTRIGTTNVTNSLICDKADIDGDVKTKKSPVSGSFSASAKNCTCDATAAGQTCTTNFQAQLEKLGTDCDGLKSLKGDVSVENGIKKIKMKIKGDEAAPA
jgi:hypothetical protein